MLLDRQLLNRCFNELAKIYKKANRHFSPTKFEIVMVGGSAVVGKYNFRLTTSDVDADGVIFDNCVEEVAKKLDLSPDWLNNDFKKTASYSPKIFQYSVLYREFLNVLSVRVITREYLIAMKLKSYRGYKNDLSDIIGILIEENTIKKITLIEIKTAVKNLYGDYLKSIRKDARIFIEKIVTKNISELKELYKENVEQEKYRRNSLLKIDKYSNGQLNEKNIESTIRNIDKHKSITDILKEIEKKSK